MDFSTDVQASILAILPEILMTVLAIALLALDVLWPDERKRELGYVAGIGLLAIIGVMLVIAPPPDELSDQLVLGGMIRHDPLAQIFRTMVILGGALSCLVTMGVPRLQYRGDFYAVLIVTVIGTSLMSAAADLVMGFLALEMTSITAYLLVGYLRGDAKSSEAGLKYFLFGAFTSAISLYGLSLLYGFTGETNFYRLGGVLGRSDLAAGPVVASMVLVGVGFAFKISAVPIHFWTPDVYEGAPTPITTLLSTASKAGSMALLLRFFLTVFPPADLLGAVEGVRNFSEFWVQLAVVLSVVSMTLGNVLALVQRNIKRLLAYSTIAHAGYILMGVAAIATDRSGDGAAAVTFYMFMYVLTNALAFGVVILFANATGSEEIKDFAGLSRRSPGLALAMTLALLSLAGIPPAAGFVGKFLLFRAAVDANLVWLAIFAVLNTIIGLYYYLVVVKVMYMERGPDEDRPVPISAPYKWALGIAAAGVLLLGTVLVSPLVEWATEAAQALYVLL